MTKRSYTTVLDDVFTQLQLLETKYTASHDADVSMQLLSARLEHIELNQQETVDALREMNDHQRTSTEALMKLLQWRDDHVSETHKHIDMQYGALGSRMNKLTVLDGIVTVVGVILAVLWGGRGN